ncbi:MAG TPA: hypothetical protein VGS19_18145 [Streptosporangiaceae bacterium]|nr:hypothetical protein [Streptosporangiaceae bacterium]
MLVALSLTTLTAVTVWVVSLSANSTSSPASAGKQSASTLVPEHTGTPSPSSATGPGHQVLPTRLPGLRWVDFDGVELPTSRSGGPRDIRDGLAWGFSDTPVGALLAAVNIGVRANAQWGPNIFGPTIRGQVTGPGTAALMSACESGYWQARSQAGVPAGQPLGPAYVSEDAFRWVAYTPSAATVDVVSAGPGGNGVTDRAVTRIQVVWQRGDWRVVAPLGGEWSNDAAPVHSLTGYNGFGNQPAPARTGGWTPGPPRHAGHRLHHSFPAAPHHRRSVSAGRR